ncbi:MAG TPA: hypothetical protein VM097_10900 [Mycobacteriales bacterium]|nr:hypothetical protein [Mycobacteriales bacterium]
MPAVLVALVVPAHAAPSVSHETGLDASFTVVSAKGRSVVDLLASTPAAGGTPRLRVRVTPQGSSDVRRLYGELPTGALSSQGGVTTLATRLGGLALRVTWRETPYTLAGSFGDSNGEGEDAAGWTISGVSADTQVTLGTARCGPATFAAIGDAVAYDTTGFGAPLAQGLGLPSKGLRCFGETSQWPPPLP